MREGSGDCEGGRWGCEGGGRWGLWGRKVGTVREGRWGL